ncbi:MAG: bifunctional phosphopantothenoylcysteine decarboxylase/phosphopantothenate--cysteine ligase CoaBC [Actinobacteria bacterium]|nr:bifunctional phosphopantothenoylcysteine decarboxylase/phosphopantothenate--cysteine ligase CoaBC [Actinomycetota bacterium]MBW3649573.1 bifunctional phosphopantothenoylcysteine decarboxylase/phosphopantothenate--cysteine ligase CoaBC [Actinomycetota bacterium]
MTDSSSVADKRVVLGVSGGIAAYKAVELCRRLVDAGALVTPVLTTEAVRFVGAVTFSAVASEPARTSLWDDADPIPHTRLGRSADLVVVAPATARLVGKYAGGLSDDLLSATLLATRAPVLLCPAMHTEMWEHPAVQDNIAKLRERGVAIVDPDVGPLAGGDIGAGRLADTDVIVQAIERLSGPKDLQGVRVMVTAGGTREPIDAVRVLTNRSSGKQGYAIASEALRRGADVTLVTTVERPPPPGAEVLRVETAAEMENQVVPRAADHDVIVMAAAVADFRPKAPLGGKIKIKKDEGLSEIIVEPTHDFLVDLGRAKPAGQVLVGFAAETGDLVANAESKLRTKRLDLVVANDVTVPGAGFDHDTNQVILLHADGRVQDVPMSDKREVARAVLDAVVAIRRSHQ